MPSGHTKWGHGFCAAEFSLAAPSGGYSQCRTPWDPRGLWVCGSPPGGWWGVPGVTPLWPNTAQPKGLCKVSPPWDTREKAQEPREHRPSHPFQPREDAGPTRPPSLGPTPRREMPRACVGPPGLRLPLSTRRRGSSSLRGGGRGGRRPSTRSSGRAAPAPPRCARTSRLQGGSGGARGSPASATAL